MTLAATGLAAAILAFPAWAEPTCEPLDEPEFIALLLDGQAAADRGDGELQGRVVAELRDRVPCLGFAPRPRMLADYFVLDALAAFGTGGDWEAPLAAAIRIRPGVDRIVGAAHPMSLFVPPEPVDQERSPVPAGARVFVDGDPAASLPAAGELHLVQVTEGELWRSGLFFRPAADEAFVTDPLVAPPRWTWWGTANAAFGPGGVTQRRVAGWPDRPQQPAFVPTWTSLDAWPALTARAGGAYGLVGFAVELDVGLVDLRRPVGSHAQAAVLVGRPALRCGAGAGVGGSTTVQGRSTANEGYQERTQGLPYALASCVHATEAWDAGLSAGAGPSSARGSVHLGRTGVLGPDDGPLRVGLSGGAQRGWFTLGGLVRDQVGTTTWRAGLELGVRR